MKSEELVFLGALLIGIGLMVIFAGLLRETLSARGETGAKGEIRGGGVIMIGPIPLIFGTDRESAKTVIVLAVALVILTYILFRRG